MLHGLVLTDKACRDVVGIRLPWRGHRDLPFDDLCNHSRYSQDFTMVEPPKLVVSLLR